MNFDTLSVHGGNGYEYEGAVSVPIFQTSTYIGGNEYSYSRCSNPTRDSAEKALALLEQGKHGFAFCSGLAAVSAVFSLLKCGDRVIVSDDLYGGTYRLIEEIFKNFGIDFAYADMTEPDCAEEVLDGAKMLFTETPTNPMMKIADIKRLADICKKTGTLLAVDNTFLTPYFQNPLSLGADIVVHSATKFLSGHHDTLSGAVMTNDDDIAKRISCIQRTLGNMLSPFDCWLLLRGIKTFPMRMEKHEKNAFAVAELLESHPRVERVIYPGLPTHGGHSLCARQARGFGGVVSFYLKDADGAKRMLQGGSVVKFAESLGGPQTLVTYPVTQTHASMPESVRSKIGITDRLIRLSAGLEAAEDIIADLEAILR